MVQATLIYFLLFLFVGWIESTIQDSVGCASDEFSCKNGQCINKSKWCDSIEDCRDKSDEYYCLPSVYKPSPCVGDSSLFLCDDGTCIPIEGECDGLVSCTDGSDEFYCYSTVGDITYTPTDLGNITFNENHQQNAINFSKKSSNVFDSFSRHFKKSLQSARGWLLSEWNDGTGWREDTARGIIALHLSETDDIDRNEKELMNKQLDVQLLLALTRNSSKALSLCELSHYINAISATCRNPRNFKGYNLLGVLRERVDALNNNHAFVTPYAYLTLCIHNSTKYEDILNMWKIIRSRLSIADNFDMLSLSVLTTSCATRTRSSNNPDFHSDMVAQLLDKLDRSGIPKSVHELSLVVQALTESKVDPLLWNKTEAINYILDSQKESGSFGDFLATYYTLPILSGRSALDLTSHCKLSFHQVQKIDMKQSKIQVTYSLYFGYPVELTQKIKLQVYAGSTFLEVMHLAQENPYFRFQLDETKDVPFVYSIGNVPNDAERGLYWTLYVRSSLNGSDLVRYDRDIRYYFPKENEESVFWLRPM